LHNAIEEYTRNSDLVFIKYELLNVQFSLTKKVRGGSYIELPEKIKLSRACVNIKNNDNKCLIWSLLAYKYYDKITHNKKNEVGTYRKYEKEIKLPDDMTFPSTLDNIPKIEKLNNMKINVFRFIDIDKNHNLQTLYNSRDRNENVVNLLLLERQTNFYNSDGKIGDVKFNSHFVLIKDLAKLACKNKNEHKSYICSQCLSASYTSQEKLN
jgi:hypothetical protein